jgi:hypothetical protein
VRAILLASATATTLNGLRARSCVSQGYFSGFCFASFNTAPRVKAAQSRGKIAMQKIIDSYENLIGMERGKAKKG